MMNKIVNCLKNSRSVLVATHINPDGDAIGSLLSMGLALEMMGKENVLLEESPIPAVYRFLPGVDRVVQTPEPKADFDAAVILDCGSLSRIGSAADRVNKIPTIINIDHHVTNTGFGHIQCVDTESCATTEILYQLFRKLEVPFTLAISTAIYTGIFTDTGSFRFSNTNRAAFSICNEMVSLGVDPYQVAKHVYGSYSLGRIKLLNLALDTIEVSENGKLSMMTLTQNMLSGTGTQPEDTDGMINYARNIDTVTVAVLIQELSNGSDFSGKTKRYNVSLRSDSTVNVAEIAATFGGGGHPGAAGFSTEIPLTELKKKIIGLAEEL